MINSVRRLGLALHLTIKLIREPIICSSMVHRKPVSHKSHFDSVEIILKRPSVRIQYN